MVIRESITERRPTTPPKSKALGGRLKMKMRKLLNKS
jgi:hypothetical protein